MQARNIKPRGNHAALVDAAGELHNNLPCSVIIDDLQIADVAMLLHHLQKLDDDLGVWPDQHLALSTLLGIHNVVEAIAQHTDSHHLFTGALSRPGLVRTAAAEGGCTVPNKLKFVENLKRNMSACLLKTF